VNALRARTPAPATTCFDLTPDLNLRHVDLCAASGSIAGPNCPHVKSGWFIPGKSPIAACDVHRRVWIDNRSGLRLSGFPANPAAAHEAVLEFWPSDLARLFRAAGLPKAAPPLLLSSATTRPGSAAQGPRILSPKSDRTYQLRLATPNDGVLDLEAAADGAHDCVYWFVDSTYLGASAASSPLQWKPQVGRHIIRAVDETGRADSRVVTVNAVE